MFPPFYPSPSLMDTTARFRPIDTGPLAALKYYKTLWGMRESLDPLFLLKGSPATKTVFHLLCGQLWKPVFSCLSLALPLAKFLYKEFRVPGGWGPVQEADDTLFLESCFSPRGSLCFWSALCVCLPTASPPASYSFMSDLCIRGTEDNLGNWRSMTLMVTEVTPS